MPSTPAARAAKYESRPAAANRAARIAWDTLTRRAALMVPPRSVQHVWHAGARQCWTAYLNEVDATEHSPYLDIDEQEVRDRRVNPHRYAANDEPACQVDMERPWNLHLTISPVTQLAAVKGTAP
jgi:hypothetical protein